MLYDKKINPTKKERGIQSTSLSIVQKSFRESFLSSRLLSRLPFYFTFFFSLMVRKKNFQTTN
jgi:hypothetical protein